MCEKAVDTCPFMLDRVPNCYKMQKNIFSVNISLRKCAAKGSMLLHRY